VTPRNMVQVAFTGLCTDAKIAGVGENGAALGVSMTIDKNSVVVVCIYYHGDGESFNVVFDTLPDAMNYIHEEKKRYDPDKWNVYVCKKADPFLDRMGGCCTREGNINIWYKSNNMTREECDEVLNDHAKYSYIRKLL